MRLRDPRLLLTTVAVILLAVGAWALRYFGQYRPFADLMGGGVQNGFGQIGLEVHEATVIGRAGGRRRWRIRVGRMTLSKDRRAVTAEDLHDGLFYDALERPVVVVSARRARYESPGGLAEGALGGALRLEGGIRATLLRRGGPTLETETLIWDALANRAQCPGRVTATLPGGAGRATAGSLTLDTIHGDLTLSHLRGTFRVAPGVLQP